MELRAENIKGGTNVIHKMSKGQAARTSRLGSLFSKEKPILGMAAASGKEKKIKGRGWAPPISSEVWTCPRGIKSSTSEDFC